MRWLIDGHLDLAWNALSWGRDITLDKVQTYTLVRRDGRWACAAFQNTKMSRRTRRAYDEAPATGVLGALRRWRRGWPA